MTHILCMTHTLLYSTSDLSICLLPSFHNMQTRSNAIEQVQRGLQHLGPAQTNILQQQLPEFAAFTLQLLSDHNFKVVTAGLSVLADAARTLGQALQQHMRWVNPGAMCSAYSCRLHTAT